MGTRPARLARTCLPGLLGRTAASSAPRSGIRGTAAREVGAPAVDRLSPSGASASRGPLRCGAGRSRRSGLTPFLTDYRLRLPATPAHAAVDAPTTAVRAGPAPGWRVQRKSVWAEVRVDYLFVIGRRSARLSRARVRDGSASASSLALVRARDRRTGDWPTRRKVAGSKRAGVRCGGPHVGKARGKGAGLRARLPHGASGSPALVQPRGWIIAG